MSGNAAMADKVATNLAQRFGLTNALKRGCTVDELRQRVIDLAGINCLLRGFPAEVQLRPLVTEGPDTVPVVWEPEASSEIRRATSPAATTRTQARGPEGVPSGPRVAAP